MYRRSNTLAKIKLGQKVRDSITGMEGTAVARTEFLYGCVRIAVQTTELKGGTPVDAVYIDEPQLELVKNTPRPKGDENKHGPRPDDPGRTKKLIR